MTDEPLTTCPTCGAEIRRVLFPTGVVFKGSGFYKTDHRDTASAAASAKDAPTPTGENGKTETAKTASDGNTSSASKPAETGTGSTSSDSKSATPTSAA